MGQRKSQLAKEDGRKSQFSVAEKEVSSRSHSLQKEKEVAQFLHFKPETWNSELESFPTPLET